MKKGILFVIVLCLCITLTFNEKKAGDSFLQQSSLYIVVSGVPEGDLTKRLR